MTKINVVVPTGENALVELVRYFDAYDKKYLVYTLNEKDEQGFVKLYVAKVTNTNGVIGEFIDDDNEWKLVKDEFKKIIGENSDSGKTSANDLNPNEINNINIKGHRVIKLMETYVNLLSANQKTFVSETPSMPTNNFEMPNVNPYEAPSAPTNNFEVPNVNPYEAPSAPTNNFEMPNTNPYETPSTPTNNFEMPNVNSYEAPSAPTNNFEMPNVNSYEAPSAPTNNFEMPNVNPYEAPSAPTNNFEMPNVNPYEAPSASTNNFEELYNDMKARFERCNAELEKVTNENVELRIKLDDILEILNEN